MHLFGLFVLSACIVIGSVTAYDFEDAFFNQILLDELDEFDWSARDDIADTKLASSKNYVTGTRNINSIHIQTCCETYSFKLLREYLKPYKKQCLKKIKKANKLPEKGQSCLQTKKQKKDITCLAECIATNLMMSEDGYVNVTSVINILNMTFANVEWIKYDLYPLVRGCLPSRTTIISENSCNSQAIDLTYCIWKEIQLKCPEDRIVHHEICEKIRHEINENQGLYTKVFI